MKLQQFRDIWKDTPEHQRFLIEKFKVETDAYPKLKELRDWVEEKIFGFGCRSFYMLHKMLIDSFEHKELNLMEIGVFRGQTIALWRILEELCNKRVNIYGITPLDSSDGHWESDYEYDIKTIHGQFNLKHPNIIKGSSFDPEIINCWNDSNIKLDILYIDGDHSYDAVISDIKNYSPSVKVGGYMIIDDSSNNMKCCGFDYFWGIQEVSDATDSLLPPKTQNDIWEYVGCVMHNRVFKRLK